MSELAPIVTVSTSGGLLKKRASSLTMVLDEPCSWSVRLDNSEGDYNPSASLSNPRTYGGYLTINVSDGDNIWPSPDLVVEDYDYNTETVTLSGRCRLSQLDREDQVEGTYEDTTVSAILSDVAGSYGLSVSGAPSRKVVEFQAVGNPLEWFRDLLAPTHTFRMGSGGTIIVQPVSGASGGPSYTDEDHLEIVRFKRTSEIFNKAIVERVYNTGGIQRLVDEGRSEGSSLGAEQEVILSSPSRNFYMTEMFGERGRLNSVQLIGAGDSILSGALPYTIRSYTGVEPVHKIRFSYDLVDPAATNWGAWTPNWYVIVDGYPADVDEPPEEDYHAVSSVGGGNRPYPEPFTSLAIETQSDAQHAATALTTVGTRQGNILNCSVRLLPLLIPYPNQSVTINDYLSGLSGSFVVEAVTISEDEDGDTGTISVEATRSEGA